MNPQKMKMPFVSLITVITLSTCTVAGVTDMVKKQLLQQLKSLAQHQQCTSLKKTTAGTKEVLLADSVETLRWFNDTWETGGGSRYTYDEKGRVIQIINSGIEDGKTVYQYDQDGKTIRELSLSISAVDENIIDTAFSEIKFYPGYTDAILSAYTSSGVAFDVSEISVFTGIDSVQMVIYNHSADGTKDTSSTAMVQYVKVGNNKIIEKMTVFYPLLMDAPVKYTFTMYISGNGVIDTVKAILDSGVDTLEGEYSMIISKKNPQGKIFEQISITGLDSNFTDIIEDSKDIFYYNAAGDVDSIVSQMPDDEQSGWINFEKKVYSYKKVGVGVRMITNHSQTATPVVSERNRSLQMVIPDGVTVSVAELLDLQGKVIARTTLANAKGCITLSPVSGNTSTVSLVRLKSNNGVFTCKVSSVK
jgi:hypothetical protein